MKRDWDLIRKILIVAELKDSPSGWIMPKIEGFSADEVSYHTNLLIQANLIDGIDLTTADGYEFGIINLTWDGHEFLDASRNDNTWKKVKKQLGSKLASLTFELIKEVLVSIAKSDLRLN